MGTEVLGYTKKKFLFTCRGDLVQEDADLFARRFIELAGMTAARPGRIDTYPYKGKGGRGYTGFWPLVESYLVIDVYPDIHEVELLLSTCRPERIQCRQLENFLSCQIGPLVKPVETTW